MNLQITKYYSEYLNTSIWQFIYNQNTKCNSNLRTRDFTLIDMRKKKIDRWKYTIDRDVCNMARLQVKIAQAL